MSSFTENASRLGQRIQETISEHTREMNLARSSSSYFDADDRGRNIRKQLDSSSDREKLDAMKRLVALVSKGRNVSEYFAQVVKNVASQNLEIRKLVYIYVLRYAEQEPDLALLSINTFQKDLNDSNPFIRAMALRVLSGIRVPMVGNIVVLAIKKSAADFSPYVRKVAALAIPKCYQLDNSHLPSLIQIITNMLNDTSPLSIGSVAVAFEAVCPTRLDLIHPRYRRLCKLLVEVDEWGQIDLLNLLLRYVRTMLPRPMVGSDGEEVDKDIQLLLSSSEPLLQSRNPAVVLAVVRTFWYAAPPSAHGKVVHPLLRLLQTSKEVERVTLSYILVLARAEASLFSIHHIRFFLFSDDPRQVKAQKIKLLVKLINFDNHQAIFRELIECTEDSDDEIVASCIKAIGTCAKLVPESLQQCLEALTAMINSNHDVIVSNAVLVLKHLIQTQLSQTPGLKGPSLSQSPVNIIASLARRIDDIRHPQARACVIWLVGQYCASEDAIPGRAGIAEWAPDVLRKSTKKFALEDVSVKLQIITLAAKLLVLNPGDQTLGLLNQYVFSLGRYDLNYDVRDRARMLSALLIGVDPNILVAEERGGVVLRSEQVKVVLFNGKAGVTDSDHDEQENTTIGSLGIVTGKFALNDAILPDWLEEGVESSLRDSPDDAPASPSPLSMSSASAKPGVPVVLKSHTGHSFPAGPSSLKERKWASNLDDFFNEGAKSEEEESSEGEEDDGDGNRNGEDDEDENEEAAEDEEEEDDDDEEDNEEDEHGEDNNGSSGEDSHGSEQESAAHANQRGYQAFG